MNDKQLTDKEKLVNAHAEILDITKISSSSLVNTFRDTLLKLISESDSKGFRLDGFGTFQIKERASRAGRNPKTGEPITIEARKNIVFKPSKSFKCSIN